MAHILPSSPVGAMPATVLRVFNFLKSLPDGYKVWHHLAPWQKDAPDFMVLNPEAKVLLLKVSTASDHDARPSSQLLLIDDGNTEIGHLEEQTLINFLPDDHWLFITASVVFPNIPDKRLHASRPNTSDSRVLWIGRERLQDESIQTWGDFFLATPPNQIQFEQLKARFSPEVVVPPSLTVRKPCERELAAGLTFFLLDYDQETALKADLDIPAEAETLSRDFRINLVNGVAGSGKSLILLHRLRLLYELYPGKRFLVLTHNRPLIRDMEARFYRLFGRGPDEISWNTFSGWCYAHWPQGERWIAPVGIERRSEIIQKIKETILPNSDLTPGILLGEFDWIKDQPLTLQEYLTVERRGRGFRLSQGQRKEVLKAFQQYQKVLEKESWRDWGDVALSTKQFIQSGRIKFGNYDVVLVDEAQFFAPIWFDIVRSLVKPRTGHLFIAADPSQGFLRRGASWKSLGLDVRGHSYQLKRSYRTTNEILNFATLFYRQRITREHEDEEFLAPELFDMPSGVVPQLIQLESKQDELARSVNEIEGLLAHGVPRGDILVLHADWSGADDMVAYLKRKISPGVAMDPKDTYPGNYVRVTTLNRGTGLEAPIVFLVGLHKLFEEEQSIRISDEEREALILDNTRKIYMAATRASQRLVFTYVGNLPQELKSLIKFEKSDNQKSLAPTLFINPDTSAVH